MDTKSRHPLVCITLASFKPFIAISSIVVQISRISVSALYFASLGHISPPSPPLRKEQTEEKQTPRISRSLSFTTYLPLSLILDRSFFSLGFLVEFTISHFAASRPYDDNEISKSKKEFILAIIIAVSYLSHCYWAGQSLEFAVIHRRRTSLVSPNQ